MNQTLFSQKVKTAATDIGGRLFAFSFGSSGVVSIEGSIKAGYAMSQNKAIAHLHAGMLTEGTKRRTKKQIQLFLDSIGALLSFRATYDRLEFSAKTRVEHVDEVLALIVECLTMPSFPRKEFSIVKTHADATLHVEDENTRTQAAIALTELLYEKEHPNFQLRTIKKRAQLSKATCAEVVRFHHAVLNGASLIASFAGDIDASKVLSSAKKHFAKLPKKTIPPLPLPAPQGSTTGGHAVVHVPGKASVDYMLGIRTGLTRKSSDYPALMLGLRILGNPGFTGRLMKTVREKEGLTYGTYAYLNGLDAGADGYVSVWSTFAPQLFEKGRKAVWREVTDLVEHGPTEKEVALHKDIFSASWYVRLSNSNDFANVIHDTVAEGEELSYLDDFPKKVMSVTKADVARALKKYVDLERLSETAAGTVEKDALSK